MRKTVLAACLVMSACAQGKARIPPSPQQWATNASGYLSESYTRRLDTYLQNYQRRTRHHLLVYVSDVRLGEEQPKDFAFRVFNAWGVGRDGVDDGIVVFVLAREKYLRIQVGYGLERAVSDSDADRLVRDAGPLFREGRKDEAIQQIIEGIVTLTDKADTAK